MTEAPKAFASLTSTLLARKGHAKPAMRPQGFTSFASHDDLGWNDMGHAAPLPAAGPAPSPVSAVSVSAPAPVADVPEVVRQQAEIAEELGAISEVAPIAAPLAPAAVPIDLTGVVRSRAVKAAPKAGGAKAAFTLRLDAERHLRLRLACAVHRRSAQQLVTQALDDFLSTMPEIDALAEKVPAGGQG